MAIDKFFIVNVLLLAGLVAGATYLQKTYDTDKNPNREAATTKATATTPNTASGWHLSTAPAPAPATARVVPTAQTQKASAVVKTVPKPAILRVYNEENDDN